MMLVFKASLNDILLVSLKTFYLFLIPPHTPPHLNIIVKKQTKNRKRILAYLFYFHLAVLRFLPAFFPPDSPHATCGLQ